MRNGIVISMLLIALSALGHAKEERNLRRQRTPAPTTPGATLKPTHHRRARRRPTRSPITEAPTAAPVAPSPAPVAPPTLPPVKPTAAPVKPTKAPIKPTVKPSIAPVKRTPAPVTPTYAPVANTATDPLAADWLAAHNTRRTAYYAKKGLGPKDLKWSNTLAESALNYSISLLELSGCTIEHGYQGNSYGGENLAAEWGGSTSSTPEEVLYMWYDQEMGLPFGENLHFSQVIWRGTSYVGCGIASKQLGGNQGACFIQMCRYLAPGNCNVDASNLIPQAMQDTSPCDPQCPSEGCF